MMHSVWKGSIGFGLVNIPVNMYAATDESTPAFVSIDRSNNARIRYKKVNAVTGKEVKEEDLVKGYPMGEGFVLLDEEDFKKAAPEKADHLEITEFVSEKDIDAIYYEKPYFLEPDKGGTRAYALLREVLRKEGKVALGTLVYHKKGWICLIKPMKGMLVLHRLRFAEEIREGAELKLPRMDLKTDELKMASMLIKELTKPFKPEQFCDEYSDKLMKVIEAKSKGKSKTFKPLKVVHSNPTEDMMQRLKKSLKKTKKAS